MRKAVVGLAFGCGVFLSSLSAHANLIEVTDSTGNILGDFPLGHPMVAMGSPLLFVTLVTPFTVDPSAFTDVFLSFTDANNVLKASVDLVVESDLTGGPWHWSVEFSSAINAVQCDPNRDPNCMPATGGLQDVTALFFPNDSMPPFHTLIQVDLT